MTRTDVTDTTTSFVGTPHDRRRAPVTPDVRRPTVAPLALWAILVTLGAVLVYVLLVATGEKRLDAAPLHATVDPSLAPGVALPLAALVGVVLALPTIAALRWRTLLVTWWGIGAGWALALASTRGPARIAAPLGHGDYLGAVSDVHAPLEFLRGFVDRIATYPTHVQGHPPGFVLVGWALDRLGAPGPWPLAVLVIAVGATSAPFALVAAREVAGEAWARAAAPFLVIAPVSIWIATSADAFYAGVGAAAVSAVVVATGRRGRSRVALSVVGGLLFGACAMLSYGLVLLAVVPLVVASARRAVDVLVEAAATAGAVLIGVALAGFWWIDGLLATRDRYFAGIASRRPYELFLLVNFAIVAIAVGPAIAVALARLRNRSVWLLVGGALAALVLADLSGMSKSEVERIWLPFFPFVMLSAGVFGSRNRGRRPLPSLDAMTGWLVLQGCAAILLETVVRTAW